MSAREFLELKTISFDHDGLSYRAKSYSDLRGAGLPAEVILAAVQSTLKAQIDRAAERLREQLITPGAGQAMEYQEAYSQASAALAAPTKATADLYPMLAVSIGVDVDPETNASATDVVGVARSVQAAYGAWQAAGAAIRGIRLRGKAAIDAAATVEAAADAYDGIVWPSLG